MSVLDSLAPSESSSLGESVDTGRGRYRDELNDEGCSQLALTPDVCSVVGFSSEEISAALRCLKSGRAPGPDLIPAEALSMCMVLSLKFSRGSSVLASGRVLCQNSTRSPNSARSSRIRTGTLRIRAH